MATASHAPTLTPSPTASPSPSASASPSPSATETASCSARVLASLTETQRIGQLFAVGLADDRSSASARAAIRTYGLGSWWFDTRTSVGTAAIRKVSDAVQAEATETATGGVGFFIAANQEGGLIQAVVEAALTGETGCRIILPEDQDPFVALFSESAGRVLVAVPRTEESRFRSMCEARGLPVTRIGVVDQGSDAIEVQDQFTVSLEDLRRTSEGVLPRLFG